MRLVARSGDVRARLLAAVVVANVSDGLVRLAVPLLVLAGDGTPGQAAVVMSASVAPWLVLSVPVGAALDRAPPERWSRRANGMRAGVLGAMAMGGTVAPWPVVWWLAAALVLGATEVVVDLAAQTLVPRVASDDQLPALNAHVSGAQMVANQFLGPALGGLLVARAGHGSLAVAAVLYVGAAMVLPAALTSITTANTGPARPLGELRDGLRYFLSRRDLVLLASVVGALNLSDEMTRTTLPGFALDHGPLHLDEAQLGMLVAIGGLGGLAGTVVAPVLARRLGIARLVAIAMPAIPATPLALALIPALPAVIAAMAISSAAVPLCAVAIVTHRQRTTPTSLLGRTNAIFQTVGLGAATSGGTLAAIAIEQTSYRTTFATAALLAVTAILVVRPARGLRPAT